MGDQVTGKDITLDTEFTKNCDRSTGDRKRKREGRREQRKKEERRRRKSGLRYSEDIGSHKGITSFYKK